MLSRGLLISVGVTVLAVGLLFVYFRNKVSAVEKKVELMFNLIQNYETQTHQNNRAQAMDDAMQMANSMMENNGMSMESVPQQTTSLIEVSDDDEDSEEVSDSDDESDEEEEEEETLSFEKSTSQEDTVNVDLDTIDITNLESDQSNEQSQDNEVTQVDLEKNEDSLDEEDSDLDDDEEEGEEEENLEATEVIELTEDDYKKKTVAELKQIAQSRGLINYKSLKKTPLIQLLMGN